MMTKAQSVFERHPKLTIASIVMVGVLLFLFAAEIALRGLTGLGNPVLFSQNPSYGFRLKPNQETTRFGGANFKINNLGLRAGNDWDAVVDDKILFLGDSVTYGGNWISNEDLFSEIAVKRLPGFISGNAGIPNWGVENVYGLVVDEGFMPARFYVSTFIENDFYRGLVLAENRPWIKFQKPASALSELADWIWHKYIRNLRNVNRSLLNQVPPDVRAETAANKLVEIDSLLKSNGYHHLIYISPTIEQVMGTEDKDLRVKTLLEERALHPNYILDEINRRSVSDEQKSSWFQDDVHLTSKGHQVWGDLMGKNIAELLGI